MNHHRALEILEMAGAVLNGHFVLTSGKHSDYYVNKDAVSPDTAKVSELGEMIARHVRTSGVETVVAPAIGGIALGRATAECLTEILGAPVFAVYAERAEEVLESGPSASLGVLEAKLTCLGAEQSVLLKKGQQIVFKGTNFVIKRDQEKFVKDENVLITEDILTTGGSVKAVIDAVRTAGGHVVGVACMVNRGGITAEQLGVPEIFSLVELSLEAWDEDPCPLCKQGVPVNTNVGKGREFLERKRATV